MKGFIALADLGPERGSGEARAPSYFLGTTEARSAKKTYPRDRLPLLLGLFESSPPLTYLMI